MRVGLAVDQESPALDKRALKGVTGSPRHLADAAPDVTPAATVTGGVVG